MALPTSSFPSWLIASTSQASSRSCCLPRQVSWSSGNSYSPLYETARRESWPRHQQEKLSCQMRRSVSQETRSKGVTGAKWPAASERLACLREAVALIRQLWAEDLVTFEGQYYRTLNATIYDRPTSQCPSTLVLVD